MAGNNYTDNIEQFFGGVIVTTPSVFPDERGSFNEWFKASAAREVIGHDFRLAQANMSFSVGGVIRGIHYADVPPGQAKWVTCAAGCVDDVIVDLRLGSDTFGQHRFVRLDDVAHATVYIPEGFGHGFVARKDSTVIYLTTSAYNPAAEHGVNPFDADLGIDWGIDPRHAIVSKKDRHAPSLAEVRSRLPRADVTRRFIASLKG